MDSDAARWPELRPPEALDGDGAPLGQRARLREAIERLRASQTVSSGDVDEEQRAAEADMLDVLLTLDTAAGEALHRTLPAPEGEAP